MTAETAAPCVQGVQGAQSGMASQSMLQQVQDGSGGSGGGGGAYYSSTSTVYDPEYARMEAWLDEHPDFVNDYFLRYYSLPEIRPFIVNRNRDLPPCDNKRTSFGRSK